MRCFIEHRPGVAFIGCSVLATTSAGEAGVGGVSFSNVLSDLEMKDSRATVTNDANYTGGIQQAQDEKVAARSRADAAIAGMPQASPLAMWAGIGADAFTGGLKIYDISDKAGLLGNSKKTASI